MNIQTKILTGFGLAIFVLAGSIIFTANQVSENREINHQVIPPVFREGSEYQSKRR